MKGSFMKFIRWIACAFERCTEGASARKLTMFSYTIFVALLHFIVAKIFIMGTVVATQAIVWVLLGFLLVDCLTILLIMQILKAHDITQFLNSNTVSKTVTDTTSNTTSTTTGDNGKPTEPIE